MTGVDARDGMAGKGLDTQDKVGGFEFWTRPQQEALEPLVRAGGYGITSKEPARRWRRCRAPSAYGLCSSKAILSP